MANKDKFKDFDEFFEEKEKQKEQKNISFKFADKTYKLPASMPAIIPVKMMRLREEHGNEADIPEEETYQLMLKLMDENKLEELAEDATNDQLNEILMWVMEQYGNNQEETEEFKNEEADTKN